LIGAELVVSGGGCTAHFVVAEVVWVSSRLGYAERCAIAMYRDRGLSCRVIGRLLGRAHTTVAREVAADVDGSGRYHPLRAQRAALARARRPKVCRLAADPLLAARVAAGLARRWSPEQVAGRLRRGDPDEPRWRVSHSAIYTAVYVLGRPRLNAELDVALRSGRARRRRRAAVAGARIADMVSIHERPFDPADRSVPGHWEGDLVLGARSATAIATVVERTSRFLIAAPLPDGKGAEQVNAALTAAVQDLPAALRRSLTWDQGTELAGHARLAVATGLKIYFADPHAPWQRGSNENTNGLLREYFPKGTDFSTVTPQALQAAVDEINGRPRKVLDFATAAETYNDILIQAMVQPPA
jgi:transposase, IS30 family